jgi:hypothetical protein
MLFDKAYVVTADDTPTAERVSCALLFGSDTILVPTLTVANIVQGTAPLRIRSDPTTLRRHRMKRKFV